jgi:hypothetical protein
MEKTAHKLDMVLHHPSGPFPLDLQVLQVDLVCIFLK